MQPTFHLRPHIAVEHVTKTIGKRTGVHAIYCFAYRETSYGARSLFDAESAHAGETRHYALMAVVDDIPVNLVADVLDTVRQRSAGACTVTPVFYRFVELGGVPMNERCFVDTVLAHGQQVYGREGFGPIAWEGRPVWDAAHALARWEYHAHCAECLLGAEAAVGNNAGAVRSVLLHAAMEHLCLGLVAVMLGHRPRHFALDYLLSLCACTDGFVRQVFPDGSPEDGRLLQVLSATMNTLRYRKAQEPSGTDVEVLRRRAHQFREQAIALAQRRIGDTTN